ncbi:TPA: hypothetical protein ACS7XF_000606 [Providencia alcalifaciens]
MKQFYLCLLLCFSAPLYANDPLYSNERCEEAADFSTAEAGFHFSSAIVKDKAYFYSAPDKQCQLSTFIIPGDKVEVFREINELNGEQYFYIRYRDKNNQFVTGWVPAKSFVPIENKVTATNECLEIKKGGYPLTLPAKNNHYQVVGDGKAYFYSAPNDTCLVEDVFVIAGDQVSGQMEVEGEFVLANYYTVSGDIVRGWLRKDQLWQLHHGDSYRNDVNPSELDLATRVISLWLSTEDRCLFYEGINSADFMRLLVREDHQSVGCRGAGDPLTTPVIAYFDIDKITGEVDFDGINSDR